MTKITEFSIWESHQRAQLNCNAKRTSGRSPTKKISKDKFYGKHLSTYKYVPTFIEKVIFFFSNKSQKRTILCKREHMLKTRFMKNLNFLAMEANSLNTAVTSKKPFEQLLGSETSSLEEILARSAELRQKLQEINKEFNAFPEIYTNSAKFFSKNPKNLPATQKDEYVLTQKKIQEALANLDQAERACSSRFRDAIYQDLRGELLQLKKADSSEEKDEVQRNIGFIERRAQSKAFLLNKEDRDFLNQMINVADYLAVLRSSKKLHYDVVVSDIFALRFTELRDDFLALENIEDLDVLKKEVNLVDKKIQQVEEQWNFVSDFLIGHLAAEFTHEIQNLKNDLNEALHQIVQKLEIQHYNRIEDYRNLPQDTSLKLHKKEKVRKEILKALDSYQDFVRFLGADYEYCYKDSINDLRTSVDAKPGKPKPAPTPLDLDDLLSSSSISSSNRKEETDSLQIKIQNLQISYDYHLSKYNIEIELAETNEQLEKSLSAFIQQMNQLKIELLSLQFEALENESIGSLDDLDALDTLLEKVNQHLNPAQPASPSSLEGVFLGDDPATFEDWLKNLDADPVKLFNEIVKEPENDKADKTVITADESEWEDIPLERSPYIVTQSLIDLKDLGPQTGNIEPRLDIKFGNIDLLLDGFQSLQVD